MIFVVYAPVNFGEGVQTVIVTENIDNAIPKYIEAGHNAEIEIWENEKELLSYGFIKWHNHTDPKAIKREIELALNDVRNKEQVL